MWTDFKGTSEEWDRIVSSFDNYHPTHCFHWGTLQAMGSKLQRLLYICKKSEKPAAAIQIIQKKLPLGLTYLRSDGGLAGDFASLNSLKEFIMKETGNSNWHLRIFNRSLRSADNISSLHSSTFTTPLVRVHSGLSAHMHLENPYVEQYSGNWRHNLSRAKKRNLSSHIGNRFSVEEVATIYRELEVAKNIGEQFSFSELEVITESFGRNLVVSEVRNEAKDLLSIRAALILGTRAFDLLAATSHLGRENYASNLALHGLLQSCTERGIKLYDFAGIDPAGGKGVMQFKLGAGGKPSEYVGEWDFAPKNWIRLLINALLLVKMRSRTAKPNPQAIAAVPKNKKPNSVLISQS